MHTAAATLRFDISANRMYRYGELFGCIARIFKSNCVSFVTVRPTQIRANRWLMELFSKIRRMVILKWNLAHCWNVLVKLKCVTTIVQYSIPMI